VKRYQKTATVRAVQIRTTLDLPDEAPATYWAQGTRVGFTVRTDNGVMRGELGDYLVHDDVSDAWWPVPRAQFERTYREVP
jgi:hypothetical protein